MGKRLTKEIFIERAKQIHGNKYDYSEVEYIDANTKVKIICPIHGEFLQTPSRHTNMKQGCPKCSHQSYPNTSEIFIEKARSIYGDKYTYDKVNYKNNKTPVTITCPVHGDFNVRPDNFLHNHGCPKCGILMKPQCVPWTKEKFIEKARSIYGDKYTYDKVDYINSEVKVIITCSKHGDFEITPDNFLRGHSCPHCVTSLLENKVKKILDENKIKYIQQKTFDWLRYIGLLKLDFYLPDFNIAIECQGLQHFRPVEWFDGKEGFEEIQKRDIIKKNLCEKNGIKILYYSDTKSKIPKYVIKELDQLIDEIYDTHFNNS